MTRRQARQGLPCRRVATCALVGSLLLTASHDAVAQAAGTAVLTVDQAVRLALEHNRLIRIATLDIQKAQAEKGAARARKLPGVEVNAVVSELLTPIEFLFPQGLFGVYPGTGPIPASDVTLSTPRRPNTILYATAGQPLSQLHRIDLGVQAREVSVEMAREELRRQQQDVAATVRRLCHSMLQTRAAIEAADEGISAFREIDRMTSDFVAQQTALRADALDVKARLLRAEYTAVSLRNALASQKEQLNALLGRDESTALEVILTPDLTGALARVTSTITPETAQAKARADRPDLRLARLRVTSADLDRRSKRSESIPDISLTLSYLSPFNIEFVPKNILTVGITGKWEPFDWGRKARELQAKTIAVEQAKTSLAEAEQQVTIEVNRRLRTLQEAQALLNVTVADRDAVRERLRVARERFASQATLLKDVLQLQASLADANQSYEQALGAFLTARADFDRAVGEDVR
jgi:outer membrane protein